MRSRKLAFPLVRGLRPSPDRVRETLFNWLQHDIVDSQCLDLFAGSGAFGFEALSRGAKNVTMVETHSAVINYLKNACSILQCESTVHVINDKVENVLQREAADQFNIIFVDPPFKSPICETILPMIAESRLLSDQGLVYFERAKLYSPLPIPSGWHIIKQQTQGQVQSTLISTAHDI